MTHIHPVSCTPALAQVSQLEQMILKVLTVYFNDWDNFPSVIQNLQKYYGKTPG